jgi:hypothetical protein
VLVARDYVVRNRGPITCFSVNPRGFPKPISDSSIAPIAYLEELAGPQLTGRCVLPLRASSSGPRPSGLAPLGLSSTSGNTACHSLTPGRVVFREWPQEGG